ncbi:hypothetical protein FDP41_008923 [Naegleria fowleri]|uniref:SKI-interacting protein SKIP SNW domain-containing protein n=1 Tax=Naegleria fowleri TaxID=5763 RepID=A0A6A5BF69_NAEFO|nr:uncharacterized protein FDP41_008923 [Naegleria fowleri]KAF0972674.1 hypothetical protein FDP41_008923 [Naegleria fowleri]CAG4709702.1 unnamed protein product [Naegleria fowleri]
MSTLFSLLPPPKHSKLLLLEKEEHNGAEEEISTMMKKSTLNHHSKSNHTKIPKYGEREHSDWIPSVEADFDDGGAYPEIHVSQFPLNMGRKSEYRNASGNVLSVQVDANGNVNFDKIVTQGMRKGALAFTKFSDMIEADVDDDELAKPSSDQSATNVLETKKAIEQKLNIKISSAHIGEGINRSVAAASENKIEKRQFFRYKPRGGTDADIKFIQIEEAPTDPVEPAKFHIKKMPNGPPSPPPTVMHSEPKKLTKADQANWDIPPCVSNYTNRKGIIIPLDKRILADGRNLQQITINPQFADFTASLNLAEHNARLEIKERAEMQRKIAEMEQERELQQTRELANRAKQLHKDLKSKEERARSRTVDRRATSSEGREVSERVNFNQPQKTTYSSSEVQIDSRLLNQSSSAMIETSKFDDEDYNVYDTALFGETNAGKLYNPNKERIRMFQELDERVNMKDKFETDEEQSSRNVSRRQPGPVVFQKEVSTASSSSGGAGSKEATSSSEPPSNEDDDPFGFSKFLTDTKKRKTFDHIGQKGFMSATAGSGSVNPEDYRGSKKKKMEFTKSKE